MPTELPLSCAHSAFPKLSLPVALAVVRDLGFDSVDVCVFEGYQHISPAQVVDDPPATAAAVRADLDRHELAPVDMFAIVGRSFEELAPNHPDAAVRAESRRRFERFAEFTAALGAPGITVLPGTRFPDGAASVERAGRELAWRTEIARARGLRLSFEPHYGSIAETPAQTLELLEFAPGATLALDYSHFVFQGIPQDDIDRLLPHTGHLHVRQATPGAIQARTGEGSIDFARIRDRLVELGYAGHLGLEYQWDPDWEGFAYVDCVSETAESRAALLLPTV